MNAGFDLLWPIMTTKTVRPFSVPKFTARKWDGRWHNLGMAQTKPKENINGTTIIFAFCHKVNTLRTSSVAIGWHQCVAVWQIYFSVLCKWMRSLSDGSVDSESVPFGLNTWFHIIIIIMVCVCNVHVPCSSFYYRLIQNIVIHARGTTAFYLFSEGLKEIFCLHIISNIPRVLSLPRRVMLHCFWLICHVWKVYSKVPCNTQYRAVTTKRIYIYVGIRKTSTRSTMRIIRNVRGCMGHVANDGPNVH